MGTPNDPRTSTSTTTRTTTRTKVIIAVVAVGAAAAGFGFFLPKYCAENPDRCRRAQKAAQERASDDRRTRASDDLRIRASDDLRARAKDNEADATPAAESFSGRAAIDRKDPIRPAAPAVARPQVVVDANTLSGMQVPGAAKEIARFLLSVPPRPGARDVEIHELGISFSGRFPPLRSLRQLSLYRADRLVRYGGFLFTEETSLMTVGEFRFPLRNLVLIPGQQAIPLVVVFDTSDARPGDMLTISIPREGITWSASDPGEATPRQNGADGLPISISGALQF